MAEKMGNASSVWEQTYKEIECKHNLVFRTIEEAITLEEREKPNEAIAKYKEGIEYIDQALNIQVTCPENPDVTWEKACVMIQKIKKTRAEVSMRIHSIQSAPGFTPSVEDAPPSYDEVMSNASESDLPRTYHELAEALNDLSVDSNSLEEEVIYVCEGIRIYFIRANGEVESVRDPQTLKISWVDGNEVNAPKAILQVGAWVYPLVPGVSPCYRTDYGAFVLPNVEEPGGSIGLILPSEADSDVYDILENILHGIISTDTTTLPRTTKPQEADTSTKISNTIVNGGWFLSQALVKGAEKAGELLNYTTPKLIDHMDRAPEPTAVPRKLSKGMQIAENATCKAAEVTGFVADKVGIATMKLGQFLAPHIQKGGTKLLSSGLNMSEQEASNKMQGVLTVAAGAVEGFTTVYRGLETSASILGNNLKNNTVKIVQHKYGTDAGEFTDTSLNTVGNVYNISKNAKIITPKGLAKKTGPSRMQGTYQRLSPSEEDHGASNGLLKADESKSELHKTDKE
ncbi:protein spartin isoform X2 [Aethina tumida]|uniref:protein spartin isoform X2 n=1 Tax=Aethina tumida TaxID=116153 RepID=UPI002147520B|nr:protein spartin isoform X2 [Aethina tumida]